mmetsp:Transcript_19953/g.63956  ORF Transcript_19953/g.63956 Transcript_19953/m.63956 type:complete len:211 (+) Transcript_19953:1734-2366(+)
MATGSRSSSTTRTPSSQCAKTTRPSGRAASRSSPFQSICSRPTLSARPSLATLRRLARRRRPAQTLSLCTLATTNLTRTRWPSTTSSIPSGFVATHSSGPPCGLVPRARSLRCTSTTLTAATLRTKCLAASAGICSLPGTGHSCTARRSGSWCGQASSTRPHTTATVSPSFRSSSLAFPSRSTSTWRPARCCTTPTVGGTWCTTPKRPSC